MELSFNFTNYTTEENVEEEQHSLPYRITLFISFFTCSVIGIVGNCLVVYVVARVKGMNTITNLYLVSLACADTLVLLGGPLPGLSEVFLLREQWIYGSFLCPLIVYVQYLSANTSVLSIAAFTIERYIGICHPFTAHVWSKSYRVKRVIISLWAFCVLYNGMWLYLANTIPHQIGNNMEIIACTFRLTRDWYRLIYMLDLILFYVLPLLLIVVLYSLIGLALRRSTLAIQNPSRLSKKNRLSKRTVINRLIVDPCFKENSQSQALLDKRNVSKNIIKSMETARQQVVKMLVIVASMFAVLWLPYRAWVVYNSFASEEKRFHNEWYYLTARSLVFVNSAINPILYSIVSEKFRKAFIEHTWIGKFVSCEQKLVTTAHPTNSSLPNAANVKTDYTTQLDRVPDPSLPPPYAV